ncbi:UDP-N-acetyl-D-mannosamine dehydrogenase [Paenibacillus sp.]|jgi:UDP-N-acetyl-D-mannosaminuronic acid dehydrogenase|uniref:UDP-N-acetyl-D-mannosamine dehydrogenase n=1 Tax=Paenibacillus sp. TaxID=58172 RepID=UPI002833C262|nr:UDP-N-acetyl-D-mannosamine dehydrogenase [Paenibacillus sp.]MDR0268462.1 UDP-N-acetyl-D-mannosamine dehydrogenase [Paenibacillus sp.]
MVKKVCVVGLGYIGLPTAGLLGKNGFQVHGVDVNIHTVEKINQGEVHITEPDLDQVVMEAVQSGMLRASTVPTEADVYILAVPTPFQENNKPDLTYVEQATKAIIPFLRPGNLIILESTSPVGTTEQIADWILEARRDLSISDSLHAAYNRIFVSYCPERVLPGQILRELVENDRIVGGIDEASTRWTADFYRYFVKGAILETSARTAEMAKLTENSFRDVNIAFANELSLICDHLDIDVWELIRLANRHPRVNILQPGPGVGGHCIAVDPWFLVDAAPEQAKLIHTARIVNDQKPWYVVEKVLQLASKLKSPVIACLGLSFKANIDDLRESPAITIVEHLARSAAATLYVAEPHIKELPNSLRHRNVVFSEPEEAVHRADIVLLLVNHEAFKVISPETLQEKIVVDTRGFFMRSPRVEVGV